MKTIKETLRELQFRVKRCARMYRRNQVGVMYCIEYTLACIVRIFKNDVKPSSEWKIEND